ncbi:hypothetical protein QBC35DRAFT_480209 [Podospora australis]|uniref:RBR-type E3 ubiquitin transferase n=1 Tax=Podospora australis TaxID=1536484 RepID=A0AAN6X4G9_9PEZI|nr:hypothetical protein QBC35DRAFT_480209 [Podospora australis]
MRVPNSTMPLMNNTVATSHSRAQPIYEEEDDEDEPPSRRSRPASRQTASRRDLSSRSAHRYRSTPESTRRTSLSDSDDDTDVTSESVEEVVIRGPTRKVPIAPPAPAPPPAPPANSSMHDRLNRRPEIVYEDPDPEPDMASRYTQSVRHRSPSRAPSTKRDQYRRPRDVSISRPASPEEEDRSRSKSRSRLSRRQYESDAYPSRPPSLFKRSNTIAGAGGSYLASSHSLSSKRSQYFADNAASSVHPSQLERQGNKTRLTTCVVCRDDKRPVDKTAKLKCGHRMCHPCLERNFRLSLTDAQHMPPRCCTTDLIPFKHVEKIVDPGFKIQWEKKYPEFSNRNMICCPEERCGQWIHPEAIRRNSSNGRGQAKCTHCRTKICCACHGRWHPQTSCQRDAGMTEFLEHATREGYQQCYKCRNMVELKEGCNHVKCRCGAEFCMTCGGPWRTCDCDWFPARADSTRTQRVPPRTSADPRSNPFASISQYASRPSSPRAMRAGFGHPDERTGVARPRPSSYEEEPYLSRRHDPREEHHARRMHSFDAFGHPAERVEYSRRGRGAFEFEEEAVIPPRQRIEARARSRGASFGEADFRAPRAATVVAPSPPQTHVPHAPPPPRSAFEPPSRPAFDRAAAAPRFDYSSEIHPPRGMRYASPDRFDEYAAENYTAERRQPPLLDRRQTFPHARRPRSLERRHAFPPELRDDSPDSSWEHVPTRFPSPERPMPMTMTMQPRQDRHMPPPERHMTLPERHMQTPDRHMQTPDRHMQTPDRRMQTPDRHMQLPERHMPPPERHMVAPSEPPPQRRRASSLDRRLADRFNPDNRQSPGGFHGNGMVRAIPPAPLTSVGVPIGHMGPMGLVGPLGPLSPGRGPPALSRVATHPSGPGMHSGPSFPVAPIPPPAVPGAHTPRRHTLEEDAYLPGGRHPGQGGPPEWFGPPGMGPMGFQEWDPNGGSPRAPHVRRRPPQAHREHNKQEAKPSVQAGLSGSGRGLNRVSEWVNYIEPGLPEEAVAETVVG